MEPEKVKKNLLDLSGVVSVRIESDNDTPMYRVKLAKSVNDESRVEKQAKEKLGLGRFDSFENSDQQLILRLSEWIDK